MNSFTTPPLLLLLLFCGATAPVSVDAFATTSSRSRSDGGTHHRAAPTAISSRSSTTAAATTTTTTTALFADKADKRSALGATTVGSGSDDGAPTGAGGDGGGFNAGIAAAGLLLMAAGAGFVLDGGTDATFHDSVRSRMMGAVVQRMDPTGASGGSESGVAGVGAGAPGVSGAVAPSAQEPDAVATKMESAATTVTDSTKAVENNNNAEAKDAPIAPSAMKMEATTVESSDVAAEETAMDGWQDEGTEAATATAAPSAALPPPTVGKVKDGDAKAKDAPVAPSAMKVESTKLESSDVVVESAMDGWQDEGTEENAMQALSSEVAVGQKAEIKVEQQQQKVEAKAVEADVPAVAAPAAPLFKLFDNRPTDEQQSLGSAAAEVTTAADQLALTASAAKVTTAADRLALKVSEVKPNEVAAAAAPAASNKPGATSSAPLFKLFDARVADDGDVVQGMGSSGSRAEEGTKEQDAAAAAAKAVEAVVLDQQLALKTLETVGIKTEDVTPPASSPAATTKSEDSPAAPLFKLFDARTADDGSKAAEAVGQAVAADQQLASKAAADAKIQVEAENAPPTPVAANAPLFKVFDARAQQGVRSPDESVGPRFKNDKRVKVKAVAAGVQADDANNKVVAPNSLGVYSERAGEVVRAGDDAGAAPLAAVVKEGGKSAAVQIPLKVYSDRTAERLRLGDKAAGAESGNAMQQQQQQAVPLRVYSDRTAERLQLGEKAGRAIDAKQQQQQQQAMPLKVYSERTSETVRLGEQQAASPPDQISNNKLQIYSERTAERGTVWGRW